MHRQACSVLLLLLAVGCTRNAADATSYRPSMTQLRIGEFVEAELPQELPVIPEDDYIPGIVVAPETFEYDDSSNLRRPGSGSADLTDFSFMKELENPKALDKHVEEFQYSLLPSALVDEHDDFGIEFSDVHQGAIGDCYLAAALTSVVFSDNDNAIRDGMVRTVDVDGNFSHYVVRFYDAWGDPQDIEVDAQLVRRNGKALYARSGDSKTDAEELWPGIVEKAYAKWHGGFEKIGNGGFPGDVMQALTGAQATRTSIKYQSEASLHRSIKDAVDAGRPVSAWTFGEDSGVDYAGSGVYAWHAYSVLDSELTAEGEYRVQLRNPWGSSEPAGNGPDDGIFWFSYRDFYKLYSGIGFGGKYERDITAPANVTDLKVIGVGGSLAVNFTTTGDDATSGLAAAYDLRVVRNSTLDDSSFLAADKIVTPAPQAPGTEVTLQLGDLEPGDYQVAVRMVDESGNLSALSNIETFSIEGDDPRPPVVDDPYWDFSSSDGGWSATGDWTHAGGVWWLGNPSSQNYDFGRAAQGRLVSPPADLTPFAVPYVIWEHAVDVESGADFDQARLEISDDGFATSTVIWEKNTSGAEFQLDYVYLDAYAGRTVQFAFVFDSIDDAENSTRGWQISTILVDSE